MTEISNPPITFGEKRQLDESRMMLDKFSRLSESVDVENPEVNNLFQEVNEVSADTEDIKKRTIDTLGLVDKKGTGVILQKLRVLSYAVMQEDFPNDFYDQHRDADEILHRYLQSGARRQLSSPLQELLSTKRTNTGKIEDKANRIAQLCDNPNVVWTELIKDGVITQQYLDNMDQVLTLIEMSKKWLIVESALVDFKIDQRRAIRAKVFSPYVTENDSQFKEFVSPALVDEIIEGRFDMGREFSNGVIQMFTQVEEEAKKPGLTFRQKAARTAAGVAISVILAASATSSNSSNSTYAEEIIPTIATGNVPAPIPTATPFPVQQIDGSKYSIEEKQDTQETQEETSESDSPDFANFIPTENSDPGSFKDKQKKADWKLRGSDLGGLYKSGDAKDFVKKRGKYGWVVTHDENIQVPFSSQTGENEQKSDIEITGSYNKFPTSIQLPQKYGYLVNPDSIKFTVDGKIVSPQNRSLSRDSSGNYLLSTVWGSEVPQSKKVQFSYGLVKSNKTFPRSPDKLYEYDKYPDTPDIPWEVYEKYNSIAHEPRKFGEDPAIRQKEIAEKFEQWIKTDFIYSLNPAYSDYYQKAKDSDEFISRVFDKKHTDCDVANTAFLVLVRNAGLSARMAFGYNNGDNYLLNKDKNQLVRGEAHGWVEVYIDGRWVPYDATPIRQDESAARGLEGSGLEVPNLEKEKVPENIKEILIELESLKREYSSELDIATFLAILGSIVLYGYGLGSAAVKFIDVKYKGYDTHSKIGESIKSVQAGTIEKNTTNRLKDVFNSYLDKETNFTGEKGIWSRKFLGRTAMLLTPILRRRLYKGFEKRFRESEKRADQFQDNLAPEGLNVKDIDPMDLFIKIGNYDRGEIDTAMQDENLKSVLDTLNLHSYSEVVKKIDPDGKADTDARRLAEKMLFTYRMLPMFKVFPGRVFPQNISYYEWRRRLQHIKPEDLNQYLDGVIKNGIEKYKKEANARRLARQLDPSQRDKKQTINASLPQLSLSDEELKEMMQENVALPFAAMWHLARS